MYNISFICYIFFTVFFTCNYKNVSFNNILLNKKLDLKYKQVNYVKGVVLGVFSPYTLYMLYSLLFFNKVPYFVSIFGALYASLDMSSTLYNYKYNHISTNVHHLCVQFLYYYCLYLDWDINTLCYPIIIYASFSALAFLVNYRLAIRGFKNNYEKIINSISLYIYLISCVFNWSIQYYLLIKMNNINIIYTIILLFIIYDDIYLIRYLKNNI